MKSLKSSEILLCFRYFCASALMLTVIQAPFGGGFLGWICLVPFMLVCRCDVRLRHLLWVSFVVSFVYWVGNIYWVGYVTIPACVLLCVSQALYWPILVVCVRYVRRRWEGWLWLAAPVFFVGAEGWQGVIYTGFNWRLLGHSQWNFLPVIQISDVFGALGVSVVVAMVNGLVAGLIIAWKRGGLRKSGNLVGVCVVVCVVAGSVVYGYWRLGESEGHITAGPMLGSVQSNIPSDVKELSENADVILDDLLVLSDACFDAGAVVVCWPETIVLSTLNPDYVSLCGEDTDPVRYDGILKSHTKGRGYVLLGAHAATVVEPPPGSYEYEIGHRYNSAYLYRPDGKQDLKRYDKIHLVPFGEYIPFKDSAPFIYRLVLKLSPYDYDYNLTKGTDYTTFAVKAGDKRYGFGVLICYEDTDPDVTRKMVVSSEGEKKADWLVNISNDGWYVRYKGDEVLPSTELSQRTVITVFRAIENRVSVIRSVNTGISCLIDSRGRIREGFAAGNLPESVMGRQGVEGWFVDRVEIDDRVTFFSRHGQWLDKLLRVAIVGVLLMMIGERTMSRFAFARRDK